MISLSLPGLFSTHLSLPLKRVCFKPSAPSFTMDKESWRLATDTLSSLGIDPLLPSDDISTLPRTVQYVLCVYASLPRGVPKRIEEAALSLVSDVLNADPGLVNSMICVAKYGTACVARLDEVVRPRIPLPIAVRVSKCEVLREMPRVAEDPSLRSFVCKAVSHVVMKLVNARSPSEVLEYLRFYRALVEGVTGYECSEGCVPSLLPWVNGFEVVVAKVEIP